MSEAASVPLLSARSDGARAIGVSFLAQLLTSGLTSYLWGVFLVPVTGSLGISRTAISLGLPIVSLTSASLAPLVGRAVDTRPLRPILVTGALLLGGSLALLSRIRFEWQGALLLVTLAGGTALSGSVAASALVVRAFAAGQRRALGLASVGTSAGGFLMPLLAGALIARLGWRDALLCLGALGGLLLASAARFGVPARADVPARSAAAQPFSWRGALRAPNFWLITVYMALIYGTNTALITHLPAFARDSGSAVGWSALIASVFALFSLLGKLAYSAVGDRLDVRAPLWLAGAMQAPALLLLLTLPSYPVLLVAAAANGLGTGAVLPAWSALIARCFSGASFGRVLGFSRLFAQPVMSTSAVFAGWAHDATGSYQPAFQGFLAASLVVAVLPLLIRVPQRV